MKEVGVVISAFYGKPIYWHKPENRTSVALEDSQALWNFIWEQRNHVLGFAHSHPGRGVPGPSYTDTTTFAAIESALGRRLHWWITSEDRFVFIQWDDAIKGYAVCPFPEADSPRWLSQLRLASNYNTKES